jgi:glyoxylase-like metal-dependent hydrolase (beta-lactamase superfamily II)
MVDAFCVLRGLIRQFRTWWLTRGRRVEILQGRLSIHFLGGGFSWMVPVLFGELFAAIRYRSLLLDPGGSQMRASLRRHLEQFPNGTIELVAATHTHEEHCCNLELAAEATGAAVGASPRSLTLLRHPPRVPVMRRLVIGQPEPLVGDVLELSGSFALRDGTSVEVIETPGHSDDHVSLWVHQERLLLVGDGFMGTHFSTPNDDVDHRLWIMTLERLIALQPEIIVEGHGHVHTVREDVLAELDAAGMGMITSRRAPVTLLLEKLSFLRRMAAQVDAAIDDGLPRELVAAGLFEQPHGWGSKTGFTDAMLAFMSAREFGRHKFVRSFQRTGAEDRGPSHVPSTSCSTSRGQRERWRRIGFLAVARNGVRTTFRW